MVFITRVSLNMMDDWSARAEGAAPLLVFISLFILYPHHPLEQTHISSS